MDWFLWGLPLEEAWAMEMKAATTLAEMVEALECAILTLEVCLPVQRRSYPNTKRSLPQPPSDNLASEPPVLLSWTNPCPLSLSQPLLHLLGTPGWQAGHLRRKLRLGTEGG